MGIFIDSCFYMALVDQNDSNYERSIELLETLKTGKYGQIITSIFVLSETLTLVSARTKNHPIALKEVRDLLKGKKKFASILNPTSGIMEKTFKFFFKVNQVGKRTISYVDCSNIQFCKARQLEFILSFDRHFDGWIKRIY